MFSPSDVNLSNRDIMFLAQTITGGEAKRAADKPGAIAAFTKALNRRIGEDNAMKIRQEILMSENANTAHELLGRTTTAFDAGEAINIDSFFVVPAAPETKGEPILDALGAADTREEVTTMTKTATATKPETEAEAAARRGRKSALAGKKLTHTKDGTNPRREGTHGYKSHQIILDNPGITTEAFLEAGGRMNDLNWDISHGHVKAA